MSQTDDEIAQGAVAIKEMQESMNNLLMFSSTITNSIGSKIGSICSNCSPSSNSCCGSFLSEPQAHNIKSRVIKRYFI